MPPASRRYQKPLGPAPLASFDRGLSSEFSFDEALANVAVSEGPSGRRGHIGVLCQTSIMEETTSRARTRTIACQTDRSALRDGVRGKQRKSSQSQTSFDQEPIEVLTQRSANPAPSSPPARPESSLFPAELEVDRQPSPSRPSTLDLAKKQKKSPTTFSKVQKLELKSAKPPPEEEKRRTLLGKKESIASTSAVSEKSADSKSRSSSFRSPFARRRDDTTASTSSRAVSPMLQIRQRIASLSPGRGKKKNVAKSKLEALMSRVAVADQIAGTEGDGGESALNPQRSALRSPRPAGSHSLSPNPTRKKESHALNKLQALIDRSRLLHVSDANHEHGALTHTAAELHQSPADRRRSKSTPPEPEPYMQHRLSLGAVWGHHGHGHHHHHGHHGHGHGHAGTTISNSPSNPPSPFEEVTKKFSVQEDNDSDEIPEEDIQDEDDSKKNSPDPASSAQPLEDEDESESRKTQRETQRETELEDEKKIGETLLTTEDADEVDSGSVNEILDKVLREKAKKEILELREKVQAEREKRQTFRTAPVERPRSQTRDMPIVDLTVYVAEAEKQPAPSTEHRIKLNLHLNQDQSIDEDSGVKPVKCVDPDDWKRFCQQGLLNKRRSRLERGAQASESVDEWADFNKWSRDDKATAAKTLPIPMIIETAWTPMEHRILNVTPSPSTVWEPANPDDEDGPAHGDVTTSPLDQSSSRNGFDESFNSDDSCSHLANVIVIVPPTEAAMSTETSSTAEVAPSPQPEPPKQSVPLRKAPAAPVRKAPPPPGPPQPAPAVTHPPDTSSTSSSHLENPTYVEYPTHPETSSSAYSAQESWDTSQYNEGVAYDPNAYYYPEYYAETQTEYYPPEYYENWQYAQTDASGTQYNSESYYYGESSVVNGDPNVANAVLDNSAYGGDGNSRYANEPVQGNAVEAVLGSRTDITGQDSLMSDPSAIDIAHEKSDREHDVSTTHQPIATAAGNVEHSPLLLEESQGEDEDDDEEDAANVIVNAAESENRNDRNENSATDSSFQPLGETVEDDGTNIDYARQTKHRRLSKVPYTSLDVDDNQDEEAQPAVPEEETVTPLLEATDATDEEPIREIQPLTEEPITVENYDPTLYDPAIYDPAGTGYDINSQEYYDYYYGHLQQQQPVETSNPAVDQHEEPAYYQEPSATVPSYEYNTSYPSAEDYSSTYSNYDASAYDTQTTWQQPEPEWPTYNAYVPPVEPAVGDQGNYAETSEEEPEEVQPVVSGLPKERLFDEEDQVPFGNLRPEPKKKETSVPLHLKMAKGLKPSKKKIVNLITKGKYSSGKKKDLFDELEQNFTGPVGGVTDKRNPAEHSEQWKEYQNMTSRVQGAVEVAKLKHTPLQTPTSPSEPGDHRGPPRPPPAVHTPAKTSHVEELFQLNESNPETEISVKKSGPPGRPPPPKGKPNRPPPPKKSDVSPVVPAPEIIQQAPPAVPDVSDELADFFGGPIPVQKRPDRSAVSVPQTKPELPKSPRPVHVVPPSTKAVSTDIKPVARPKAGGAKTAPVTELSMPPERQTTTGKTNSTESSANSTLPTPVVQPKKSNVDDLLGLFDEPEVETQSPASAVLSSSQNDPFLTSDPFSTSFHNNAPGPGQEGSAVQQINGADPTYKVSNVHSVTQENSKEETSPVLATSTHDRTNGPDDIHISTSGESVAKFETFETNWEPTESHHPASAENINGISSASTTSSWEPWGTSDPAELAASQIVQEAISSATAEELAQNTVPTTAAPPRVPARPPPPPRPAPPPSISRKDMFLQSTSEDSDATFAAAFSHTQDESPDGGPHEGPAKTQFPERETKIVSQVESMVVQSQPSPVPVRKTAQIINATPWGDDADDDAPSGFAADFENDPFGDSAARHDPSADPFGDSAAHDPAAEGFGDSEPPSEEATMLKLVASYKQNAPEKINVNASLLDDSFFDPFATIVPEESPLPVATQAAEQNDDDFAIWETPAARPDTLPKEKVARRASALSNASRRTSGSVQTPLYDEDDTQPMPEFTWDHPQTSWELLLRCPPKKTFSGTRYWKQIHVRLSDTMLQLFNKPDEPKPFHELPLQGNYMVTEITIQPLDVFTKIHTTKIEYVFYKERVGIRPGQITKASKGQITKLGLPLEHASQTTELLKFGSLNGRVLRDFVHAVEDVLFRTPMVRDRQMVYKQEEVQAHVIDEFTAKVDKSGIISDRKGRVRVYCLSFVSGMPEVEFGLNDIARKGREVVGRHDILPIYTEEWIRMENVELHHCVSKAEYEKSKIIKFVPPDACFFELVRFRVRPPRSRELPLAIKITFTMEGYRVGVKVEAQTTAYYNRKRAQPCDDIQIRVPIPESWIYLFRTEKLFGYGSKHATSKKSGLIKGMSEKLRTAGVTQTQPSQIAVTSGSARYEHVYRSLVWRISRLPKEGQGAFANHMMTCRLDLNSYDTMPERFEPNAEIEFTMPAATASHTTLRSISATCDEPPEKWVKYLAKYEYVVEIDYKIDRGDVQLYGGAGATD